MLKKTITKTERIQLIGLLTIAHQAYVRMDEADKAMQEIVGSETYGGAGVLSDAYFDEHWDIDALLKNMKIKVVKNKKGSD